jgi:hypothetical protein
MDFENTVKPKLTLLRGAVTTTTEMTKILNGGNVTPKFTTSDHQNRLLNETKKMFSSVTLNGSSTVHGSECPHQTMSGKI